MNAASAGQLTTSIILVCLVMWGWWQLIKMTIRAEQKREEQLALQSLLAGIGDYLIKRDEQKAQPTQEYEHNAFSLDPDFSEPPRAA